MFAQGLSYLRFYLSDPVKDLDLASVDLHFSSGVPVSIASSKTHTENSDASRMKVLVVDDSAMQRRTLSLSLQRWGYDVLEAENGVAALAVCHSNPPDIVLSDWMMPEMNGIEFCREFRALPRQSYGYFILLTSNTEKDAVANGLDCGADDFLPKPVNTLELKARIAAGARILAMERELVEKNRLLENSLQKIQALYSEIDRDLLEARKLQQSLVRDRTKNFGAAQVSLLLEPSGHVGGDLVGFIPEVDGKVCVFAIDVSGHGISSALMTARLAGFLSGTSADQNIALHRTKKGVSFVQPHEIAKRLNHLAFSEIQSDHYFTMLIAVLELATGLVSICQAGHPSPFLLKASGESIPLGDGGFPIGLFPEAEFTSVTSKLAPNDRLLIASDGVTECPNEDSILLEENGLEELMASVSKAANDNFLPGMVSALKAYRGSGGFPDDISAVLLDYHGPPRAMNS